MLRTIANKTMLIEGKIVTRPDPIRAMARTAGVELLGERSERRARFTRGDKSIYLVDVRIVIRVTGRLRRHLSRYLVARDERGVIYDIFLGLVYGPANTIVDLWSRLRLAVGRFATRGLNPWQVRSLLT